MTHSPTDTAPRISEEQATQLRQGVMLGRMRYVLGISCVLAVVALIVVYAMVW